MLRYRDCLPQPVAAPLGRPPQLGPLALWPLTCELCPQKKPISLHLKLVIPYRRRPAAALFLCRAQLFRDPLPNIPDSQVFPRSDAANMAVRAQFENSNEYAETTPRPRRPRHARAREDASRLTQNVALTSPCAELVSSRRSQIPTPSRPSAPARTSTASSRRNCKTSFPSVAQPLPARGSSGA